MAREEDKKFYQSKQWKTLRTLQLMRQPLCEECSRHGRMTAANHVDHVVSIAAGGSRADESNLASLCASCHSKKTAREDGGFGRTPDPHRVERGCRSDGLPTASNHPWNNIRVFPRPDQELPL